MTQEYTLDPGQHLQQDLMVLGGRAVLEKDSVLEGDAVILGGEATLAGEVRGQVVVFGGSVEIPATAIIDGDVVALATVRRDPAAQIKGNVVTGLEANRRLKALPNILKMPQLAPLARPESADRPIGLDGLVRVMRTLATMLLVMLAAFLIASFLPDNLRQVTALMSGSPWLSLGIGLLTIMVLVILLPILIIICLGIPVAIVLGVAFVLAALLAWTGAGRVVGQRLVPALKVNIPSPLHQTLAGVLFVTLLSMVPCVGPILAFLVVSWGVGAAVLTRFGMVSYPSMLPVVRTTPLPPTWPSSAPTEGVSHPGPTNAPIGEPEPKQRDTKRLNPSVLDENGPDTGNV